MNNQLTPELAQFIVQILIGLALAAATYKTAINQAGKGLKEAATRSTNNTTAIAALNDNIASLKRELQDERSARESAIASLEEWKNKYAASQEQIRALELRISLQDKEIADYKKAMNDYQAESQELRGQLEFERELRGALKQQTEANGTFMTKALETVERIVAPIIQSASQNAATPKLEAQPVKAEASPA